MERSLLDKSKVSMSLSEPPVLVQSHSFYEYHWDGPRRLHVPVWQPRQTTLFVVFDGESRHLFSVARIVVYHCNGSPKDARSGDVWDIQPQGSVIHALRGNVPNTPNSSALPKLTVAFEVVPSLVVGQGFGQGFIKSPLGALVLRTPEDIQELRSDSINVLVERELPLTSETSSLSLSFTHSTLLCTLLKPKNFEQHFVPVHPASQIELITTRIVRVLPVFSARPRIANGGLPTELLIKTFRDGELYNTWHDDLLSFAQVCQAWACAMDVLHARLVFSEDDESSYSRPLLDVHALARAVRDRPQLGRGFRQLTTDNFGKPAAWEDDTVRLSLDRHRSRQRSTRPSLARFMAALITILGTTKYVQCLHLGQLDPSQSNALFGVLHDLNGLQTLSLGAVEERPRSPESLFRNRGRTRSEPRTRLLSVVQLARCMARWPALTSLKVHHIHPGLDILGLWRVALRPPACALTQLTLSRSHLADRDLAHLFAGSAGSLEHVVLDRLTGITNVGLAAFLRMIARTVVCLTVRDVALPPHELWGSLVIGRTERALDCVVHTMVRLHELRISGDIASEFMLDRRSKKFVALYGDREREPLPVVRLWLEDVPRLCGFAADRRWPGWYTPGKSPLR